MNGQTHPYVGSYTLTGETTHGVVFEAGEYQLTANNLKIVKGNSYTGSAIDLKNGAALHLVLAGENTLTGGWEGSGIRVNEGTSLTISGDGILHAGYKQDGNGAFGAAIGGYCDSNFGTITINGGTIYATGTSGASIGSGNLYHTSNTMTGTIVLNGGTIYADLVGNPVSSGAVLKGSGAKIYCTSVRADTSDLNEIVYSKNGTSATVYGNATLTDDFEVPSSGLTVPSGTTLTIPAGKILAVAQDRQIVGSGTIVNNGRVKADCTLESYFDTLNITIEKTHIYNAEGVCSCNAVDPMRDSAFTVTGIGDYSWDEGAGVLTITGSSVTVSNKDKNTATTHRIYIQGTANVTLDGVNIETGSGAPIEIRDYNDTNVTLTLSGSNTLISQTANKAAIHKTRGQQGDNSAAATLTINGSGSLTAIGGSNAAGIGGGGYRGDTHNIIINSGTINAKGTGTAAGIGSSDDGSTWNIVINGGNVTASGDPGIGANTENWQGVKDAAITDGMVITTSYRGSTPTGGLVSTDSGKTYTVYSEYTLSQNLTIASDGKLTVAEGAELTVADGVTLTNNGVLVNDGTISGNLANGGAIYNKGTLPANVGGSVYEQYVTVNNGSGTGNYTEGSTVTITADAPASEKMFAGWTTELGTVSFADSAATTTTFTMPAGCVIVKANYVDYADIRATITDSNGNVRPYTDDISAQDDWKNAGGTLTVYTDDFHLDYYMDITAESVLDLNGHSINTTMLYILNSCTIKNGTILMRHRGNIGANAVVTFENVTIAKDENAFGDGQITNNGTIVDIGLTLGNGVTISGSAIKTGLTENRVTISGVPEGGFVFDGNAHEPTVKFNDVPLIKGTDYAVTFSNSSGGDSITNVGTITMTIVGMGNYAGTVTKTYTIVKGNITPSVTLEGWKYGENAKTPVVTGNIGNGAVTYLYKVKGADDSTYTSTIPTNAGSYTVKAVIAESDNCYAAAATADFVIAQTEAKVETVPGAVDNLAYNGSAQTLIVAGTTNDGTMRYSLEENGPYLPELPKATAAGTYKVWYTVDGDANHTDGEVAYIEVTIDKADPGIGTVTAGVIKDSVEVSAIVLTRANTTVEGTLSVNAGQTLKLGNNQITYTFTPIDTANYKIVTGTVTVTVADTIAPTGKVTVSNKSWTEFLNTITFGLFFKETQTVTVEATDNFSGVAKIEYYESTDALGLDAVKALASEKWTEMDNGKVTVTAVNAKQFIYYIRIADKSGNIAYLSTNGAEFDTSAPVISGVDDGVTYYTTQTVTVTDKNLNTVTLNGKAVTGAIALEGNKEATYTIVATDKVGNSTTVTVKIAPISDIAESVEGKTDTNVTSDDKANLQSIVDTATELLKSEDLTPAEKTALEKVKADAEELLDAIEDAANATDTDNTSKVENVTSESVTPEDKTDLEKAKTDLEKALEANGGNYTEAEKKAIKDEIKRIDDALKVVENVETVETAISKLPATVEPDDEENVAKIEAAKKAYDALSAYEKSLVGKQTKETLDKLAAAAVAYDIIKGDGSEWTQGAEDSITFTANGLFSKFSGVKVDGQIVDAKHYEAKAGSTIITLKASYLETLTAGEHTIAVVYTDGETAGTFEIEAKSVTPETGDHSNVVLWSTALLISVLAAAVLVIGRKRFV